MKKIKLCKDCKWHCPKASFDNECHSPKNVDGAKQIGKTLVTGTIPSPMSSLRWLFCDQHRSAGRLDARIVNMCGKAGRWFEAKENKNEVL